MSGPSSRSWRFACDGRLPFAARGMGDRGIGELPPLSGGGIGFAKGHRRSPSPWGSEGGGPSRGPTGRRRLVVAPRPGGVNARLTAALGVEQQRRRRRPPAARGCRTRSPPTRLGAVLERVGGPAPGVEGERHDRRTDDSRAAFSRDDSDRRPGAMARTWSSACPTACTAARPRASAARSAEDECDQHGEAERAAARRRCQEGATMPRGGREEDRGQERGRAPCAARAAGEPQLELEHRPEEDRQRAARRGARRRPAGAAAERGSARRAARRRHGVAAEAEARLRGPDQRHGAEPADRELGRDRDRQPRTALASHPTAAVA